MREKVYVLCMFLYVNKTLDVFDYTLWNDALRHCKAIRYFSK